MISLQKWAERLSPPPKPNTLRSWARNGQIIPAPVKLGRAYYVQEHAKHIAEVMNGPKVTIA